MPTPYAVGMAAEDQWKYKQIAGELRDGIRSGKYPPGSRLPSLAELISSHKTSHGPVSEAIKMLRAEGLVITMQGSGTFVADPLPEEAARQRQDTAALAAAVERLELNLIDLYGKLGFEYPHESGEEGGASDGTTAHGKPA